jgi:hypothetical protein
MSVGVTGKGGIQPASDAVAPVGPGPGSAWPNNPNDKVDYFKVK